MLVNLNDVLLPAKKNGYAVGLFNTTDTILLRGVLSAAQELGSPVIIGTAQEIFPYGPLRLISPMLIEAAKSASVPVVLHLDHGLDYDTCLLALKLGYTSIMYDCSTLPFEDNIRRVSEIAKIAHSYGATIEGELGHVGSNADAIEGVHDDSISHMTDPHIAEEYVDRTGVDALAIAVGNAHGTYPYPPKLNFELIKQIEKLLSIPLVLHGGSGLSDNDFREAIRLGICKINIFTDINIAAVDGIIKESDNRKLGITHASMSAIESVKNETKNKMKLFSSDNRYSNGLGAKEFVTNWL